MAEHRWRDALPILLDDISENPDNGWTCLYIGSCFYELRDPNKACDWFNRAELLMQDNPTPVGCKGDVAHLIGDAITAGELYQEALAIDPGTSLRRKIGNGGTQSRKYWENKTQQS